ncbi:hypothetical protein [Streptacidiphilus jiangxiensis]|uniref:Uncharacterized protein n=1 Tax=Streptacidiphilus jiangxiensis TaxID=235985 RepID=A0A1H7XA85_STRJI|nr:hypothetical protein [Streptacidiphilus jiangxiensis]SEM30631.1 hypothetical protein SAMN05414137_12362 [Streptacidiphilus jiangxiensis]
MRPAHLVPPLFAGFCDDAALFPPGNAPVADAVPMHRAHRAAWYAPLVGPFLVGADRIAEVGAAAEETGGADLPLDVSLVVRSGPAGLAAALDETAKWPGLHLVGVELGPDADGSMAEAAARGCAALDRELPGQHIHAAVELRRDAGGATGLGLALDVLAGSPYRAKYRTGGLESQAFPGAEELAAFITGCASRELGFKCTAGLHHAVRHTDPATGFTHHGFLNILLATHFAVQGADAVAVAEVLADHGADGLAAVAADLTDEQVERARRAFTAYGTCSLLEPLEDLTDLGLLPPA